MEEKVVTIKDIASDLGVSLSTIHKVIYNKKGVSEKTKQRVMQYIKEHNYRINRAASSLKRRAIRLAYVGIAPDGANKFYYSEVHQGVLNAYKDYQAFNVELDCYVTTDTVEEQLALLEKLYAERRDSLDGILLTCVHEFLISDVIRRFTEAGIKVVTISSDAKNSTRGAFVCSDGAMAGRVAAELIVDLGIQQNGQLLLIGGRRELSNHRLVLTNFISELGAERPDVDVIDLYQSPDIQLLEDKICKYLKAFKDIGYIYCITARGTYAMCRAVQSLGLSGRIKTIGTDVYEELTPFFEDRTLTATIFQNPRKQSATAMACLYNLITLEAPVEEFNLEEIGIVVRNNMKSFL